MERWRGDAGREMLPAAGAICISNVFAGINGREREREEADNTPLSRELRLPDLMDLSS